MSRVWSALADLPHALWTYRRDGETDAAIRAATERMVAGPDWPALRWPELLDRLIALGRTDIPIARLAEGHIDALRILRQADLRAEPGALYGVWASRSGGGGLRADKQGRAWRLRGSIPFASGAALIDRALVTAATDDTHLLFDLPVQDWPADPRSWTTGAMAASRSFTVAVDDLTAGEDRVVGPPGFYLDRPGFFPGGVGVAAVWLGGAARVADLVAARVGGLPRQPQTLRLGAVRTELAVCRALLAQAGHRLAGTTDPTAVVDRQGLATEVRAGVGAAVRRLLDQARALAGPAGLAQDGPLGSAIADLDLYVRQQHADIDAEFLGRDEG